MITMAYNARNYSAVPRKQQGNKRKQVFFCSFGWRKRFLRSIASP